jgi:hypothetical protein
MRNADDIDIDCERCGRRRHSFFDDPVGDLLSYLCEPSPWCNKIIAIAHNANAFDSQFILRRVVLLKWTPELILTGLKIISMKMQHILFLDSISYLPSLCLDCSRRLNFYQNPGSLTTITRKKI